MEVVALVPVKPQGRGPKRNRGSKWRRAFARFGTLNGQEVLKGSAGRGRTIDTRLNDKRLRVGMRSRHSAARWENEGEEWQLRCER